jgi:hypothetical protein
MIISSWSSFPTNPPYTQPIQQTLEDYFGSKYNLFVFKLIRDTDNTLQAPGDVRLINPPVGNVLYSYTLYVGIGDKNWGSINMSLGAVDQNAADVGFSKYLLERLRELNFINRADFLISGNLDY